jgi:hypothetical protein
LDTIKLLSRLGGRGYQVREDQEVYSVDFDPDSDFDPEESESTNGCTWTLILRASDP